MAILKTIDTFPGSSAEAARVWDERYLAGVVAAEVPTWASESGNVMTIDEPRITFPIALGALKYMETKGDNRFTTYTEITLDLSVSEFDAGVEAPLLPMKANAFAYSQWLKQGDAFLRAEKAHVNDSIVDALVANAASNWDGLAFFHAAHLSNPADAASATFSNYQATAKNPSILADLTAEISAMREVLDPNGRKLGVEPDTLLVPTNRYQQTVNMLSFQQLISDGSTVQSNPFYGKLKVVHVPELPDDDWYIVDSKLVEEIPPWVATKYAPADSLGIRHYLEDSDFFKDTGRIKTSSHIWYAFSLGLPHAIRLVAG